MKGSSARIVEMEATSKLEAMLVRINGVKNISSVSGNGWGRITIELDKHTPIDEARFETSTIIRQTWHDLPLEVSYPSVIVSRSDSKASIPFVTYTINAAATPYVIQQYAENTIKPKFNSIKGLYKTEISGATPLEWQLTYNADLLQTLGITINDMKDAISNHYAKNFLGISRSQHDGKSSWIRVMLQSGNPGNELNTSSIIVKKIGNNLIRLNQLVTAKLIAQEPRSYYRINGLNSVYLSFTAEELANQLQLKKKIDRTINEIKNKLPAGYQIHKQYDATEYIHNELNKIYIRSGLTMLILLLFVLLVSRSIRYLLLILSSLAVNLAIASIFYYLFKLEIQLYSLAGITISLSLIIDNTIVMSDHLLKQKNKSAFLPLLAATLTTAGVLCITFVLDDRVRLNLQDFAAVVIINLLVSLAIALFLVPSIIDKIGLKSRKEHKIIRFKKFTINIQRLIVLFNLIYGWIIVYLSHRKWIPFTAAVLLFGLPISLLPDKIDKETSLAKFYNTIFDNSTFKDIAKPLLNKILGGTLRLFADKVSQGSYFNRDNETVLTITASMPNGTTIAQMNGLMEKMEQFLSRFREIKQYQTNIYNPQRAAINVLFKKESEQSGFPYLLKSMVVTKALELGGGSWGVYGLQDLGFTNDIRESAGSYRVKLYGYNYDELEAWADTLKTSLLSYRRIKEVNISSDFSWYKDDHQEFFFELNRDKFALRGLTPNMVFTAIQPTFTNEIQAGRLITNNHQYNIILNNLQNEKNDMWTMRHIEQRSNQQLFKLNELAAVSKGESPQEVAKRNQQYQLALQYEYIGVSMQGRKVLDREVAAINKRLPMGYTAKLEDSGWSWRAEERKQYWLLGLLVAIIFLTTAMLFNSLKQPLAILFVIPFSYIGVFLTFYWFDLNFDQGGFTSMILLSGITVNASIYILNEYNRLRRCYPQRTAVQCYLKAWNIKIVPILLTIISTILGFAPFLIGEQRESFWFPLAAGTIGGLIMSVAGIWLFLPLMAIRKLERAPAPCCV